MLKTAVQQYNHQMSNTRHIFYTHDNSERLGIIQQLDLFTGYLRNRFHA